MKLSFLTIVIAFCYCFSVYNKIFDIISKYYESKRLFMCLCNFIDFYYILFEQPALLTDPRN